MESIFNKYFPTKIQSTNLRHWLYYLTVESLKAKGMKAEAAFEIISKVEGEGQSTIDRIYYRMKKKAEKNKLGRNDILRKEHLYFPLKKRLEKISNFCGTAVE